MNKNIVIGAAVAIVVIAGATGYMLKRPSEVQAPQEVAGNAGGTNMSKVAPGSNVIYVPDQKPGSKVNAATLVMDRKGFLVVRADDNGKPGAVIGQTQLITETSSQNISIDLSRAAKDGETLYAMLYGDNGDGIFKAEDDKPILDPNGNPMYMVFQVSANAATPAAVSF